MPVILGGHDCEHNQETHSATVCLTPVSRRDAEEAQRPQRISLRLLCVSACNTFVYFGAPLIFRAAGSVGGLSRTRKANRSAISCGLSCFSNPSGIKETLLT